MEAESCEVREDPIIAEIDAHREAHAAQFNYDIRLMLRDVQSRADMLQGTPYPQKPFSVPKNPEGNFSYEDPIVAELDAYREQ